MPCRGWQNCHYYTEIAAREHLVVWGTSMQQVITVHAARVKVYNCSGAYHCKIVLLVQILVSCTKGILNDTLETPQHILSRVLPSEMTKNLAYLSGPSFAAEVAAGQPTVVTIASANDQAAGRAQMLLSNSRFRCYRTNDVEGMAFMQAYRFFFLSIKWCVCG